MRRALSRDQSLPRRYIVIYGSLDLIHHLYIHFTHTYGITLRDRHVDYYWAHCSVLIWDWYEYLLWVLLSPNHVQARLKLYSFSYLINRTQCTAGQFSLCSSVLGVPTLLDTPLARNLYKNIPASSVSSLIILVYHLNLITLIILL